MGTILNNQVLNGLEDNHGLFHGCHVECSCTMRSNVCEDIVSWRIHDLSGINGLVNSNRYEDIRNKYPIVK